MAELNTDNFIKFILFNLKIFILHHVPSNKHELLNRLLNIYATFLCMKKNEKGKNSHVN